MEVVKVTSETFETEVLKSKEPVLIDFFADWCGPCKMLSPIVDEIAQESEDIKVVKINVDESPDIAMDYRVMSIPTLIVIKDGQEKARSVGFVEKAKILELFIKKRHCYGIYIK